MDVLSNYYIIILRTYCTYIVIFIFHFKFVIVQEAGDIEPTHTDSKAEPFRAALDKAMTGYLKGHYPSGIITVSRLTCLLYSESVD